MEKITKLEDLPQYDKIMSGELVEHWTNVGLTEGPRVATSDVLKFFEFLEYEGVTKVVWASDAYFAGRAARLVSGGVSLAEFHEKDIPDEWIEARIQEYKATGKELPTVTYQESFMNQHNADWVADCLCYEGTGIDLSEIYLYKPLVEGAGWGFYINGSDTVILSPRVRPELDSEGRLHNTEGPAIYNRFYALHGLAIPPEYHWVIKERDTLTRKKIDGITNAEIRRVVIRAYPDKYIQGDPVQSDEYGDLYLVKDDEDTEFDFGVVRVKNAADEKIYWLRVPATVKTAHEGVASTFGLTAEEYRPQIQT